MISNISAELTAVIVYLLPGFLAGWVYYGLTSHPKPPQFERIVQALIFTFIVQVLLVPTEHVALFVGKNWAAIGIWSEGAEQVVSLILAIGFGATLAVLTNTDGVHSWLRKLKFTTRTSHPSEWFYVFSEKVTFVVLHLKDGRRLYGWPKEWPIEADKGQFYMMLPAWIDKEGDAIDLDVLDGILIQATDVQWVEFMREQEDANE